jgi:DNA (cytosine-5)-methyltransferase 1
MGVSAYYNENDPAAAAWLRELIKAGEIADGVVDDRGIEEVTADDVSGFGQCHFFAGIGAWSLALRRGGWDDDRPVWTASLPCQPFSAAGKREGVEDRRHLWPVFFRLVLTGKPRAVPVLGEQVSGRGGLEWFDLVSADLENEGYAIGAADTCAAGFGAPHLRQRLYWLADARERGGIGRNAPITRGNGENDRVSGGNGDAGVLADAQHAQRRTLGVDRSHGRDGTDDGRTQAYGVTGARGEVRGLADAGSVGRQRRRAGEASRRDALPAVERRGDAGRVADAGCGGLWRGQPGSLENAPDQDQGEVGERQRLRPDAEHGGARSDPGPVNGHWRDADWLLCRDNKWRPVEPGAFPLVTGAAARVGRLRGYGNSLCVPQAEAFVRAAIDALW